MSRTPVMLFGVMVVLLLLASSRSTAQAVRKIGGEFIVNTVTTGVQRESSVALRDNHQFIVVWSGDIPGQGRDIRGRAFDWDGTPRGDEFPVNTITIDNQNEVAIETTAAGSFAVVWVDREDSQGPGIHGDIRARLFTGDETPGTGELTIRDSGPGTGLN